MRNKQLRVWLTTEDLKIGDRFRSTIDAAIRLYDKLPDVRRTRNIVDFTQSKRHEQFEKVFAQLLRELKA
jgi:hypothetical protein